MLGGVGGGRREVGGRREGGLCTWRLGGKIHGRWCVENVRHRLELLRRWFGDVGDSLVEGNVGRL